MIVRPNRLGLLAGLFVLTLAAGCRQKPSEPGSQPDRGDSKRAIAEPARDAAISDEEIDRYGADFERAALLLDTRSIGRMIDSYAICEVAFQNLGLERDLHFLARDRLAADQLRTLTGRITDLIRNGGTFQYVHSIRRQGHPHALFRITRNLGGDLNYLEFSLGRGFIDSIQARDIEDHMEGDRYSLKYGRELPMYEDESSRERRKLKPLARTPWIDNKKAYREMMELQKRGKTREALAAYSRLPDAFKAERPVQLYRLALANSLGREALLPAIDEARHLIPDIDSADLLWMRIEKTLGRFDKMRECCDRLDRKLGGDPFLDCFRALSYRAEGDLASARVAIEKAVSGCPNHPEAHTYRILIDLDQKDHARTRDHIKTMIDTFKMTDLELETMPLFAEFKRSPEGVELLEYLTAKRVAKDPSTLPPYIPPGKP